MKCGIKEWLDEALCHYFKICINRIFINIRLIIAYHS